MKTIWVIASYNEHDRGPIGVALSSKKARIIVNEYIEELKKEHGDVGDHCHYGQLVYRFYIDD